jgi:sulfatase modifying factor 1
MKPDPVKAPDFVNPADGYEMMLIPAGKAIFGSADDDPDAQDDEKPQFEAELPDYYLGLYCVTIVQYAAFLNAVDASLKECDRWIHGRHPRSRIIHVAPEYKVNGERWNEYPAGHVTWDGAHAYCEWAGLRLPTELECEKGARGPRGLLFPWGDEWEERRCRHKGNAPRFRTPHPSHYADPYEYELYAREQEAFQETCHVSDYPQGASAWGLYNMSGNVNEWCSDWYESDAYGRYANGDLTPPSTGSHRATRGGCFRFRSIDCRTTSRFAQWPSPHHLEGDIGFRCARGL